MGEERANTIRGIIATALAAGEGRSSFLAKHAIYASEVFDALMDAGAIKDEWQKIETAPRDGVYLVSDGRYRWMEHANSTGIEATVKAWLGNTKVASYWMPLPALPNIPHASTEPIQNGAQSDADLPKKAGDY